MIVCFRCSRKTKEKLDSILEAGEYSEHAEVISSAIDNLHLLLGEVGPRGTLILGEKGDAASTCPGLGRHQAETEAAGASSTSQERNVPGLFRLSEDIRRPNSLVALGSGIAVPKGEIPLHQWVFGQFNKLLPAKASLRGLANLAGEHPDGFDIDSAGAEIASEAAALGAYLEFHDKNRGLSRDEAFAVAFPSGGVKAEKSVARYAHHFVGRLSKFGVLSGMLSSYRFLAVADADSRLCQLTEAGWSFARMESAILDDVQDSHVQRFTEAEVKSLLDHISGHVPEELSAFKSIARAVQEGKDTPTSMDAVLSQSVPDDVKAKVSSAFLSAQRSGVVSRMADLGLLTRVRCGTRVRYEITDRGTGFVSQLN